MATKEKDTKSFDLRFKDKMSNVFQVLLLNPAVFLLFFFALQSDITRLKWSADFFTHPIEIRLNANEHLLCFGSSWTSFLATYKRVVAIDIQSPFQLGSFNRFELTTFISTFFRFDSNHCSPFSAFKMKIFSVSLQLFCLQTISN